MSWLNSLKSGFSKFKALGSKIWDGAGHIGRKVVAGLHDKRLRQIADLADVVTKGKYKFGDNLTDAGNFGIDVMKKYKGMSGVLNADKPLSNKQQRRGDKSGPHIQPHADISRGETGENRYSTAVKPSGSLERQTPKKNEDYLGLF